MIGLRALGPPLITRDGQPIALQPKRVALLVYLALAERAGMQRRDTLLGVFWPEQNAAHARGSLRQALRGIRQALGDDILVTRGDEEVGVPPDRLASDVYAFEGTLDSRTDEAIALYSAPFCQGFHLSGCPEFDHWVETQRDRLGRAFADAVEQTARVATAAGDHDDATGRWRRLVLIDPYSARAVIGLMNALAASGDRAAALAQFERYADRLKRDLDVEPETDVVMVAEKLKRGVSQVRRTDPSDATTSTDTQPASASVTPKIRRARGPIGIAAAILAVAATWAMGGFGQGSGDDPADVPRLLVLPMENLSGSEDEYFADGMTDEITAKLARLSGLRVIARQTAIQYKGSTLSAREIGEALEVDYVLEGTVRMDRASDGSGQVRITPQLIRASDETHLWSEAYTADLVAGEIFRMQAEIATRIAEGMDVVLLEPEREAIAQGGTDSQEAYDYYLRGWSYRARGTLRRIEDRRSAVEMFERATELDSEYVDAYVALASTQGILFSVYAQLSAGPLAKAAVDRVTELLPPDHPTSLRVQAAYHRSVTRRHDLAEQYLAAGLRTKPNDANIVFDLADVKKFQGKYEEALTTYQEGLDLDPRHQGRDFWLGRTYYEMRRYTEAETHLDRHIAHSPDSHWGHFFKTMLYLTWDGKTERAQRAFDAAFERTDLLRFLLANWDFDDAMVLRIFADDFADPLQRRALRGSPDDSAAYYLAKADAAVSNGRTNVGRAYSDSARVVLERRLELRPADLRDNGSLGLAYAGLGRFDDAKRTGERAVELSADVIAATASFTGPTLARIYVLTGDYDAAIDRLEQVLSVPSIISVPLLRFDTLRDPLRDHQRFQRLLMAEQ